MRLSWTRRLDIPQCAESAAGRTRHGARGVLDHFAVMERGIGTRILRLPRWVKPYCIVPLGWPRGRYGPTTRKPVEQVVHLDQYGNRAWLDT